MPGKERKSGHSLLEVVVGIAVLIPVALLLVDLGIILLGTQANASACRNAVQAAASGAPSEATYRAEAVVRGLNNHPGTTLFSKFTLVTPVQVKITSQPVAQTDLLTGEENNPGGPIQGTVAVSCQLEIKPLILQLFCGNQPVKLQARQTSPIVYVLPANHTLSGTKSKP